MDDESVRKVVLIGLEYSYKHDDWVNPLADALAGVTAADAAWRPTPTGKGIWDIVLHLAVWTENTIERMESGEPVRPERGWPPLPAVPDEAAWKDAQRRLWEALAALNDYVETKPLDSLAGSPYGMGDLLCRFIHNAYHIGQITKAREIRDAQRATESA